MSTIQDPPTIEEVLKSYGIDPDQLPETDDRGLLICPFHHDDEINCSYATLSPVGLSHHCREAHGRSAIEGAAAHLSHENAWEEALTELVRDRGYSLSAIASVLPSHTGLDKIQDDAERFNIDYEKRVAGGPNSKIQHYLPEEVGLSPLREGRP